MAFSGGAYSAAGKCSQLVDWYQNLHRSRHSSFSLAPAQLHARLAAQPPCIHLVSEIHCSEPWSNCILCLCVSVCVRARARLCYVSISDKTVKLWKISERDKRPEGYNLKDEDGRIRNPSTITSLRVRDHTELSGLTPPKMSHGVRGTAQCLVVVLKFNCLAWSQEQVMSWRKFQIKHFNLQLQGPFKASLSDRNVFTPY